MTTAEQLDDRYGRTRKRKLPIVMGSVVAAALVIGIGWTTVSQSINSVDFDDLAFELIDEHTVSVRGQVSGGAGKDVACAIEALDAEFGVVGWKIIELPASPANSQSFTAIVPTVGEATTGLVNSCWVV